MAEAPNVLREQEHSAGLGNGERGALVLGDEVSPEARNFEESTSTDSVKAHSRTVGSAVDEPANVPSFLQVPYRDTTEDLEDCFLHAKGLGYLDSYFFRQQHARLQREDICNGNHLYHQAATSSSTHLP
ncbi:uncharacterized protein PAC_05945 [Phialocephala subalpina]|uniref:Uncharacterized protein n=1 Tax=Phialocephala subalpina TaxID=576137 RepID=A0A1L7WTF9_9HELO|nr:uncharacterized protein PAC_05945 [Phialocephala subalpina]